MPSTNGGAGWRQTGIHEQVSVHDFIDKALGQATDGVYDIAANTGWVCVGTDSDTAVVRGQQFSASGGTGSASSSDRTRPGC